MPLTSNDPPSPRIVSEFLARAIDVLHDERFKAASTTPALEEFLNKLVEKAAALSPREFLTVARRSRTTRAYPASSLVVDWADATVHKITSLAHAPFKIAAAQLRLGYRLEFVADDDGARTLRWRADPDGPPEGSPRKIALWLRGLRGDFISLFAGGAIEQSQMLGATIRIYGPSAPETIGKVVPHRHSRSSRAAKPDRAKNDDDLDESLADEIIKNGEEAVIMSLASPNHMSPDRLKNAGIRCIMTGGASYYALLIVRQHDAAVGGQMFEILEDQADPDIASARFIYLTSESEAGSPVDVRQKTFDERLKKSNFNSNPTIVKCRSWDTQGACDAICKTLKGKTFKGKDPVVIAAFSSPLAQGAVEAINIRARKKTWVVASDITPGLIDRMYDSRPVLLGVSGCSAAHYGACAVRFAMGTQEPGQHFVNPVKITPQILRDQNIGLLPDLIEKFPQLKLEELNKWGWEEWMIKKMRPYLRSTSLLLS